MSNNKDFVVWDSNVLYIEWELSFLVYNLEPNTKVKVPE